MTRPELLLALCEGASVPARRMLAKAARMMFTAEEDDEFTRLLTAARVAKHRQGECNAKTLNLALHPEPSPSADQSAPCNAKVPILALQPAGASDQGDGNAKTPVLALQGGVVSNAKAGVLALQELDFSDPKEREVSHTLPEKETTLSKEENPPKGGKKKKGSSPEIDGQESPKLYADGSRKDRPATEADAVAFCLSEGLAEVDGKAYWAKWEGNGFTNDRKRMKDWRQVLRSHALQGYLPSQRQGGRTGGQGGRQAAHGKPVEQRTYTEESL